LRLEAALPLHGHELSAQITTLEADLGWVIGWDKLHFRGREALAAQRASGVSRMLCGIKTDTRRPPRDGARVMVDGRDVGVVTSGNYSPSLGVGIALALIAPSAAVVGTTVSLLVRDSEVAGTVVERPFVRR
jgi:aminomethyltransferase